jgi:hypothetical protein
MLRGVTYRTAATAAIFLALWFLIGFVVLRSPLPGWLGIGNAFFSAWLLLFFACMALTGIIFIAAAGNAAFPPRPRFPERPLPRMSDAPPHVAPPVRAPNRR